MKKLFSLLFCFSLFSSLIGDDAYKLVTSVKSGDRWQFINEKNEKLFARDFTYATYFSDGVSCVSNNGQRTFLNPNVLLGAEYYAIDTKGKVLDGIKSDQPFFFHEGLAVLSQGNQKLIVDKTGKVLFNEVVQGIGHYKDGMIIVFRNGKIEFLDKQAKTVIGPAEYTVGNFSEGRANVKLKGKIGYIDETGEVVIDYSYLSGYSFSEGLAVVGKTGGSYYIDKDGKEKLGPYTSAKSFKEGIGRVLIDGKWYFINKEGEKLFGKSYLNIDFFSEGLAIVELEAGKVGIIDKDGNFTKIDARVALAFRHGIAIAEKNQKMGYIDTKGNWVIEAQYDRVHDFTKIE